MSIIDISELTTHLLTISAVTKVLVDILKLKVNQVRYNSELKWIISLVIPVAVTMASQVSIFETDNGIVFYIGSVGAGLIAGLGSNFIHESMRVLETLKTLRK